MCVFHAYIYELVLYKQFFDVIQIMCIVSL